jgi:rod shape-determining protein MreB and related proteins
MIFNKIIGLFSSDLSIDLGTANTLVIASNKGIIINEPSVVAVKTEKHGQQVVLAVGHEAKAMVGKTPGNIKAIRPMKDGVIADFDMTEKMIRKFIEKAHGRSTLISPRVIICVPVGLTQVERKAVRESALSAGAREVFLIQEPMAAAIGAGIDIRQPQGNLVVDIGGGTTEIGVVSLGGLVLSKSIRVAGDRLDRAIVDYVRRKYSLVIGERTAEIIKIEIGTAVVLDEELSITVNGRDQVEGLLSSVKLTSEDAREAMSEPLREVSEALRSVLEEMPPDIAGDIVNNGIILTGGGALIRQLDKFLSDIVRIPVYVADEPLLAVARGTGRALEEIDLLQELFN